MNDRAADIRRPAERFYWGVLDVASLPPAVGRRKREQLDALFETVLPVPIESVHAVYAPIKRSGSIVLACAADAESLRPLAADPSAVSLSPSATPPEVLARLPGGVRPDPAAINLLTGPYTPARIRAASRRRSAIIAASCVIAAAFFVYGTEARVASHRAAAADARDRIGEVHARVLPPAARPGPRHHEFLGELRRVRRAAAAPPEQQDAADTLAALLGSWPADRRTQTRSIVVAPGAITIETSCEDSEQAELFVAAISPPQGWALSPQNIRRVRDRVDVTLRFSPIGAGATR